MSSLLGRRIALVGGAGFIGHHLALALARQGAEVAAIDPLRVNNLLSFASASEAPHERLLSLGMLEQRLDLLRAAGIDLYTRDARDRRGLRSLVRRLRPSVVIHLAGVAHADRSNRAPNAAFQHTLATLENSLDAARGIVDHFVFFSSSMVYGDFPGGEVSETTSCRPVGIYGALKYAGERLVVAHHQVFGLPYTIVRPSALYGERCVSRRVVQVFIESALEDRPLVVVGDGSERLDFTCIHDLVEGIGRILDCSEARNEVFNLTFGRARSVNELLDLMRAEFPDVRVRHEPRSALVPARGTLCVDKARSLLGYRPQHALEQGVARYVQWYRAFRRAPREIEPRSAVEKILPGALAFQRS